MSYEVKFGSGQIVNFATQPTQKDIDEVATKLGINKPVQQPSGLQKAGSFFEKGLKFGAETFINPLAKAVGTPIVSAIRGVQGKTEPIKTPFGEIKPFSEQTSGEALGSATELALTFLPVEKVVAPIAKFMGGVTKRLGGALTGKGLEVIDEIIANPELAKKGLRGDEITVLKNMATDAKKNISGLKKELSSGYKAMLKTLPTQSRIERMAATTKSYMKGVTGGAKQKVEEQLTKMGVEKLPVLSSQGLKTFVTKKLTDFNVVVDRTKKVLDFTESPLRKSEEGVLKEVFGIVNKWKDLSPEGVDRLAIKIGNYQKAGDQTPVLNSILGGLKNDVRSYIGVRYPQIAEQVAEYAKKADKIETLENILNVSSFNNTSEILKTAKAIQNIFKGDKQLERELLKQMGMGDVVATEAGRQLAQAPSRASASIGDTAKNLIQTIIPPKVIGEIATYIGTTEQKIKPLVDLMQEFAPAERISIFNALSRLFQGNQENQ